MRYAKWILIVVLLTVLTSFMGKDKPTKGLNVGNIAPDFNIVSVAVSGQASELSDFQGKYVLLSFWASYDATSRMMNTTLNHALRTSAQSSDVEMVSVSFDSYRSVFQETIRRDGIGQAVCFVDTEGETSDIYKKYHLQRGFTNYLLDANGVIVAKNLSATQLSDLLKHLPHS